MTTSSVGGFPRTGPNGNVEFVYFKNEFGEDGDLTIPEGGELILDPNKKIDKYNIDVFELWRKEFPGVSSQFVVADLTVENEKKRGVRKAKAKALILVAELASSQDFDTTLALARRLGMRKFNVERGDVVDYLEEIADTDPETLIAALDDPEKEMRFLLEKAIARNILSRDKEGMIKYGPVEGGQPIGRNENEAIVYLKQNSSLLGQIMAEIENKPLVLVTAPKPVAVEEGKPENPADVLVEVQGWIDSGQFKVVKDEKDKIKEISFSNMVMGKTPQKVVDYLLANKHFLNIVRQRTAK